MENINNKEFVDLKKKVLEKHFLALPIFDKVFQVEFGVTRQQLG